MKKLFLGITLITLLATASFFTGCVRVDMAAKDGPITTQSYDYTGFTGIRIGNAFQLEVTSAASYSVNITAGKNVLDHIRVMMDGSILKVATDGRHLSWWWRTGPKVTVTMPVLTYLDLSGASRVSAAGFNSGNALNLKISGASDMDLDMATGYFTADLSGASSVTGRLTTTGSDVKLSGASKINLTGAGGDIKLHGSGASEAFFPYYPANNADIELSGASNANMDISGTLNVNLSGASKLRYSGNPTIGKKSVTGASELENKSQP
jgi:hypothetical protein